MSTPIIQNAYVVRDLAAAAARWHAVFGIGPFVGGTEAVLADHVYRGRPAPPIRIRGCFVQSGELNIELIEVLSDGPSAFHDMFADGAEGLHHVALFANDFAATRDRYVAMGMPVVSEFGVGWGPRICYVDARATLGHMIEIYPEDAIIRGMYAQTRAAAQGWAGPGAGGLFVPWA